VKQGVNKGRMTFDHRGIGIDDVLKVSEELIIPFMQKCGCRDLRVDCLRHFQNPGVTEMFARNGMQVHPSAGEPYDVEGGYPPNGHEFIPYEVVHGEVKNELGKLLASVPHHKRSPNRIYSLLPRAAKNVKIETVRAHIEKLDEVCFSVIMNGGEMTRY